MGILSVASGASVWRGYNYYIENKIKHIEKINEDEFNGRVVGSSNNSYNVKINIAHARQSKCNCPHADGKRIICKHMVALFFKAFPQEADDYIAAIERYEQEEEKRIEEHYEELKLYVNKLSKKELQEALFEALIEKEEKDSEYW